MSTARIENIKFILLWYIIMLTELNLQLNIKSSKILRILDSFILKNGILQKYSKTYDIANL